MYVQININYMALFKKREYISLLNDFEREREKDLKASFF